MPVAVECALPLDEPDDVPDQRQQDPQAGEPTNGALLPIEILVHVTHLGRDEEEGHRREQEIDDDVGDTLSEISEIQNIAEEDSIVKEAPKEKVDNKIPVTVPVKPKGETKEKEKGV